MKRLFWECALERALVLALFAALSACAPRLSLQPSAVRLVELKTLDLLPYAEPPMFSVHYYVFRDLHGPAWGRGKVLAASWRKLLGYESGLSWLATGRAGALLVETPKGAGPNLVHSVDAQGVTVASAAFSGAFDGFCVLRTGDRDLLIVRNFNAVTAFEASGGALWSLREKTNRIEAADLDGDGYDELLARKTNGDWAAYDAKGKRLWSRSGLPELRGLTAGRLDGRGKAALVAVEGGWKGEKLLLVLDSAGRVAVSTPVAWSEATLLAVASGRLAAVGHVYPEERDFLSLFTPGERPLWRVDLGWVAPSALTAADLDGDGRDEIALGTKNGWLLIFSDEGKLISEKNFVGEISHLVATGLSGNGRRRLLVALKGIPPEVYSVGVLPDPGPWRK